MKLPGRSVAGLFALISLLGGCSSGGSNATTPSAAQSVLPSVSGTLTIALPSSGASGKARRPAFVGAATQHAYIFINGSLMPSNASSTCTGTQTSGTGTFCTISWTARLAVPASYPFQVETDDGVRVLAEGAATYPLVAGNNTLAPLALNGISYLASWATTSCTAGVAGTTAGTCNVTLTVADGDAEVITYSGSTVVPTTGNTPTTGTVYDNGAVSFVSASPAVGIITGTAQTSGSNTYSTFAAGTLTIGGVSTTGVYTIAVKCATATASGSFSFLPSGGAGRTSGVNILDSQLANESPVPAYPVPTGGPPTFTCANGVISSATGGLGLD